MNALKNVCAIFAVTLLVACGGSGGEPSSTSASAAANVGQQSGAALGKASPGSSSDLTGSSAAMSAALASRRKAGEAVPTVEVVDEQVFDWAESKFADLFPGQQTSKTFQQFKYRYYPATDLYIGIAGGEIYLLGTNHTSGKIVRVAAVSDFSARISGCAQAAVIDKEGRVVLPAGAAEVELPEDVDTDVGSLAALYPGVDTTTDAFYPNMPCDQSIGGTMPPDEEPKEDVIAAQEYLRNFESDKGADFVRTVLTLPPPALGTLDVFRPGDCFIRTAATAGSAAGGKVDCNDPAFLNAAMPFEGRDIIYVHGLDTGHLSDRIHNPTGPASAVWPQNSAAFLNAGGYFRAQAEAYWLPHLIEHLAPPVLTGSNPWPFGGWQWTPSDTAPAYAAKANRYLLVAWSTNQAIEFAQHALLKQIHLAITTNQNVVTPLSYPSKTHFRPFCANGCIVIGHSTGPLITSSALGKAATGVYGLGGKQIASSILAHVSMDGAISGSRIASIGMALALVGAPGANASNVLCPIADQLFGTTNSCNANLQFLLTSSLRDLMPGVSQGKWGAAINDSPVPTVTIAGGHPRGNAAGGLSQWFLPGVDDGVVTMNSACGNPNSVVPGDSPPSGFLITQPLKAFEFSTFNPRLVRGGKLLVSQKNTMVTPQFGYLASPCTPWLSAAGMVMPVANSFAGTGRDARARYRNHYSFIQGLAEHSYDGGGSPPPALWPSYTAGLASVLREYDPSVALGVSAPGLNVEESRAVTDPGIYSRMLDTHGTRLVKPLDMRVLERGKKIRFRMPFDIGNCEQTTRPLLKYRCTRWIWKRTYHLADKWEQKQASHYVYEYVGRR